MKPNQDVSSLLTSLAEAQKVATALGLGFVAFLIGMAILETCNAAEDENNGGAVKARAASAGR